MSDVVTGAVEAITGPNKGGYYSIKVNGVWHGVGKEPPAFQKGANVSFNAYLKDGKYSTVKGLIAVAAAPNLTAAVAKATAVAALAEAPRNAGQSEYWKKREAGDGAREQRISFYAAYERALGFVNLAIAQQAFPKLEKAKAADKLDVLKAFVLEVTNELVELSTNPTGAKQAAPDTQAELKKLYQAPEEWE